jgi:hypothetical protein
MLSACGSVASLVALVIVLVDKASTAASIDPQMLIWRVGLAFMALMAAGATIVITYDYVRETISRDLPNLRTKTVRCALAIIAGSLVTTIFVDGLFAAMYWHLWLNILPRLAHYVFGK